MPLLPLVLYRGIFALILLGEVAVIRPQKDHRFGPVLTKVIVAISSNFYTPGMIKNDNTTTTK